MSTRDETPQTTEQPTDEPSGEGEMLTPETAPPPTTTGSGFDAEAEARDAMERGEEPLSRVIASLAGFASSCWDNLRGAGVFESTLARDAVESTLAWLGQPLNGPATYIAYESEMFSGIVGPFVDREAADEWARVFTGGGEATWEGAGQHWTPGEAAVERFHRSERVGGVTGPDRP